MKFIVRRFIFELLQQRSYICRAERGDWALIPFTGRFPLSGAIKKQIEILGDFLHIVLVYVENIDNHDTL